MYPDRTHTAKNTDTPMPNPAKYPKTWHEDYWQTHVPLRSRQPYTIKDTAPSEQGIPRLNVIAWFTSGFATGCIFGVAASILVCG